MALADPRHMRNGRGWLDLVAPMVTATDMLDQGGIDDKLKPFFGDDDAYCWTREELHRVNENSIRKELFRRDIYDARPDPIPTTPCGD